MLVGLGVGFRVGMVHCSVVMLDANGQVTWLWTAVAGVA